MLIITVEIERKNSTIIAGTKAAYLKEKDNFTKEVNRKSPYMPGYPVAKAHCEAKRKSTFFSKEMYRLIASFLLDMPMSVVCRKMDTLPEAEREALTAAIWDEYHEICSPLKPL